MLPSGTFCTKPKIPPNNHLHINHFTSDKIMAPAEIAPRIANGNLPESAFSSPT